MARHEVIILLSVLLFSLVGCREETYVVAKDVSANDVTLEFDTISNWVADTIDLDTNYLADPFTLVMDSTKRQFTHEEFKRRLGFIEEERRYSK